MDEKEYLTAKEAAARLNISLPTLYAYVSRGLIRSEEADSQRRTRKYAQADVDALLEKKQLRRNPAKAAENALDWGQPVLSSAITRIENGRFFHRGHDGCDLAQSHSFEQLCGLLWVDDLEKTAVYPQISLEFKLPNHPNLRPIDQFQIALPMQAATDFGGYDLGETAVTQTGQKILSLMLSIVTEQGGKKRDSAARALQQAWRPDAPELASLLDLALCLCADHELNVSAFTVRTVASAGSTPYAAINAGLSALQGGLHGGHTERVLALLREAAHPDAAAQTIASRLRRGDHIPGFGHKLYPNGDPRAKLLLEKLRERFGETAVLQLAEGVITAVQQAIGQHPTVDLALVALAQAAKLPDHAPLTLFAIGRTAGWLGHAIEQYGQGQLIRPRARYNGRLKTGS